MDKPKKARWSLANKSKTELIEDVKILFAMLCIFVLLYSFWIGMLLELARR